MNKIEQCTVLENTRIASEMYQMKIYSRNIAACAQPGQFIHIKLPESSGLILRRPISINSVDRVNGTLYIVYQRKGSGTQLLSSVNRWDTIDILGPLGKGFVISDNLKHVFLVGGGCGIAPLRFAGEEFSFNRVTSFLGFRSKDTIYQLDEFKGFSQEVLISSDDGSIGKKGLVTDRLVSQLKIEKPDIILACGPKPMLKAIQEIAHSHKIPCQISLEERMGCGIGGCLVCSCAVRTDNGWQYKKVCTDGPVFWSEEVIFDEILSNGC